MTDSRNATSPIELSVEDIDRARLWLTSVVKDQDVALIHALCDKAMLGFKSIQAAATASSPGTVGSPLLEELDAISEGKSKLDLAEEIWRLRQSARPNTVPLMKRLRQQRDALADAMRMFVKAEDEWRRTKGGMPEGTFDDPLADAYKAAQAALQDVATPQSRKHEYSG